MMHPFLKLSLLCFSLLCNRTAAQSCQLICNGDFENTSQALNSVALVSVVACWSTTASDGLMEVWGTGFNGVNSASSNHHVELNATQAATMYQDFPVTVGQVITISFSHRGRAGVDSMRVSIGPVNGPYTVLGTYGDGTSGWGNYSITYTATATTTLRIRFTPVYWSGGNAAIGNFLDNVSVSSPGGSVTVTASSPTVCAGQSVTLTAQGATSYTWSNNSTGSAVVVSPSQTTSYSVAVNGTCVTSGAVTVTVVPGVTLSISGPTAVCPGTSVTLTASGGSSYTWSPGQSTGSTLVVAPQVPSTYTVSSASVSACPGTAVHSVSTGVIPTLNVVPSVTVCAGTATVISASGASTYTWLPGNSSGNTLSVTAQAASVYTVVGSIFGCTASATSSLSVNPSPIASAASNAPKCENTSVQLSATGGATYAWSGPQSFSSAQQNPLINQPSVNQSGVYTVTVTSASGCKSTATTTVTINPNPTIAVTGSSVCAAQTLYLYATSVSGATYSWSGPGGFFSTQQNPAISNASQQSSGVYSVQVTSVAGCISTATVLAYVVNQPTVMISQSAASICAQSLNGSPATLTLQCSGAPAYNLVTGTSLFSTAGGSLFSIGVNTPYPVTPSVGSFTVYGLIGTCSASATGSVVIVPNPTVTLSLSANALCAGESLTINASGASNYTWLSAAPLTLYSNGAFVVTNPTATATYTVSGSQGGCMSGDASITVTVNSLPVLSVASSNTHVCIGSSVVLSASGNAASYTWSPSAGLNNNSGNSVIASPLTTQQYVVVASANGCTRSAVVTVSVLPLPQPSVTISAYSVCINETVSLNGYGGDHYYWTGPNNIGFTGSHPTFTPTGQMFAGIYTLTAVDKNGCAAQATASLAIKPLPVAGLSALKLSGCAPFCSDFGLWSNGAVDVQWTVDGAQVAGKRFNHCFTKPGELVIKGVFRDQSTGCVDSRTFAVNAIAPPVADFNWLPEEAVEGIGDVTFLNATKGAGQVKWEWYVAGDKDAPISSENAAWFFADAGTFPVALVVRNDAGCADTVVKYITIDGDFSCYIPNIFTPNGDGRNDEFTPVMRGVKTYALSIFDRWGELIFSTTDLHKGWPGTFKGKDCPNGAYSYLVTLVTIHGDPKEYKGHVILNR